MDALGPNQLLENKDCPVMKEWSEGDGIGPMNRREVDDENNNDRHFINCISGMCNCAYCSL
jgi:hypothetical protein